MKVLYIVNPTAGKGKVIEKVPIIKEVMSEIKSIEYDIIYTREQGDATFLANKYSGEGYDIIFAVGGDGTVNEVANGLINKDCALAVIPGGSGNDFIKSFNNVKDIKELIKKSLSEAKRSIDVGLINDRYFINIASIGFDAEVVLTTLKVKKYFSGSFAYLIGLIITILKRKPEKIKITIDNKKNEENILLIAVANGKYYGGGMLAAPYAIIDDSKFDVCLIRTISKIKMFFLFPKFIKGKHEKFKEVSFYKADNILIEADNLLAVNIDGEIIKTKTIKYEILKKSLKTVIPKDF